MSHVLSEAALATAIAEALEPWFQASHRDLSWRRSRDPYAIWVSEIMLQQTRVETVERYYPQFLERFPSVTALAAADEESVLQAWSGLGYYRRARLLHRGAQVVAEARAGELPSDPLALRTIPGIGRYTAGAIASIAFDRPAALVDGNVARVFSRARGIDDPKAQGAEALSHWTLAQAVVERGSPRILAQALMELGATICTPRAPQCERCPIQTACVARAQGAQERIPAPRRKVKAPLETWAALVLWHDGRVLVRRRPETGLLAGLWCVPLVPLEGDGPSPSAVQQVVGRRPPRLRRDVELVRHVFTHRIWALTRFEAILRTRPRPQPLEAWLEPGERPPGGLPSVALKLLRPHGW